MGGRLGHHLPWCTPWGSGPQGAHQGKSWYTRASTRAKPGRLPVVIPVRIGMFPAWLDLNHAQAVVCPGESTDFTLVPALVLTRAPTRANPGCSPARICPGICPGKNQCDRFRPSFHQGKGRYASFPDPPWFCPGYPWICPGWMQCLV